jgi:hypothetical protein
MTLRRALLETIGNETIGIHAQVYTSRAEAKADAQKLSLFNEDIVVIEVGKKNDYIRDWYHNGRKIKPYRRGSLNKPRRSNRSGEH